MATALQRALSGEKVSGAAAQAGLRNAATTIERMKSGMARAREQAGAYGHIVVNELEASGAALAAGTLAGRYGDEKYQVGGYDGRAIVGLVGLFAGAYGRANRRRWGSHAYAVGQGVAHATIADVGRRWGERMAAKAAETPAAPVTTPTTSTDGKPPATPAPGTAPAAVEAAQGYGAADLDKYLRELTLANTHADPAPVRAHVHA